MKQFCTGCQKRHEDWHWTGKNLPTEWFCNKWYKATPIEVIPQSLHKEREKYANDTIQPFRQGELSREYCKLHPHKTKEMLKDGIITIEQLKKSKDVWSKDVKGVHV